jgi:endonuclease III
MGAGEAPRSAKKKKKKVVAAPKAPRLARAKSADPQLILARLLAAIERPHVELAFESPWQLMIAVILSAQSTDRRVNLVTPEVFRRWPDPAALAAASPPEVEEVIKSTGFFRNKTKAIIGASAMIKTANVVLGGAYRIASGIVVDTHAARVSQRLGLTREEAPEKIEADLCKAFPPEHWIGISHRLVLHGRYVCTARSPACAACPLNELCPARLAPPEEDWELRARREAEDMEDRAAGFTRVA